MPELPEVETIVCDLRKVITGKTIIRCEILQPSYIRNCSPEELNKAISGAEILAVKRRGKYIICELPNGILLSHLGMTGKFIIAELDNPPPKHTVAVFFFPGFNILLHDVRRFGKLEFYKKGAEIDKLSKLGPEPLGDNFSPQYLAEKFSSRQRAVKELIMDQSIIAGLGNIYASEILFRAKIHPLKPGKELSLKKLALLVQVTKKILSLAIEKAGATISDYKRVDDKNGEFQNLLKVYGRAGEPCLVCASEIERVVKGGRSSFYCPNCQPL